MTTCLNASRLVAASPYHSIIAELLAAKFDM